MQQAQGVYDRERVELFLAARNLKDQDIMSVSDPKCKVWIKAPNGSESLVGTTEVINNNLNPNWKKTVEIDYIFEINQYIRFEVWDVDSSGKDDLIGVAETQVGAIMGAKNQVLTVPLKKKLKEGQGHFIVKADQVKVDQNFVVWQWKGKKMMNTDGFFGKSDPFLIFFRKKDDHWLRVHETPYIKDTLNPSWPAFELPLAKLNGGNPNQNFRIECWDNSKSGNHNFIGYFETSIAQLTAGGQAEHKLENPKEKKPGYLILESCQFIRKPTFMDYLQGGEQINMMIAVDFTGSNGNPSDPHSLHSIVPGAYNQYQTALYQVSQVLLNYDYDQNIPIYGFGGVPKFPNYNKNQTEHCFPLTGSFEKPEVHGLEGIMSYYSSALQYVSLAGPTYFAPVLEYAKMVAHKNFENEQDIYTVLLILTDGEIHDFDKSMNIIIECMKLPISIIIVGVGNESFGQMKKLDGDDGPLKGHRSGMPYRDLVQFVAYLDYKNDPSNLARAVLAELPSQLLAYKALVKKPPRQRMDIHLSQVK